LPGSEEILVEKKGFENERSLEKARHGIAPPGTEQSQLRSEAEEIQTLSASRSIQKIANSILLSLDKETLAEVIAAYLYFRSKGRPQSEFLSFIVTRRFQKMIPIALNAFPELFVAMLTDKEFRIIVFNVIRRSL
jgi:hypothetical protein